MLDPEFQSFAREQRQLESHSTRKRPDVGKTLAYYAQETGIQSRMHLFRVGSIFFRMHSVLSSKHLYLLLVFQMATLFLRGSVEELPAFTVSLDGVALNRRVVETLIACVQSFVRSPCFTQRDFFNDLGMTLLVSAVNAAGSLRDESTCVPWANVLPEGFESTLVDLQAYDAVAVRQNDARDTSERWFGVRSVESSEVGEPSCWTALRISEVVEVGQVEYLSDSVFAQDQPCSRGTTLSPRNPRK